MRTDRSWTHIAAGAALALLGVSAVALGWLATASADAQNLGPTSLPRFEGRTLSGARVGTDVFAKRRGILFVFSSQDPDADRTAKILDGLRAEAQRSNVAILGLTRDRDLFLAQHFTKRFGFDFPVVIDSDGSISAKLRVPPGTSALILVDAQGAITWAVAGLAGAPESVDAGQAAMLRQYLDLPERDSAATPLFGVQPQAPPFEAVSLDGHGRVKLADYSGKVLVFLFFLPTCPHCHEMLKYLDALSRQLANPDLAIVPVSIIDKRYVIEDMVSELKLSFPAYTDIDGKAQAAYAFKGGVPEVFVIDRKGRVVKRTEGADARIEAVLALSIKRELGVPNPILLKKDEYSGEEVCSVCHQDQHATWMLTKHANAWEPLVEHGKDRDPDCLRCHTVGFGKPGGFDTAKRQDHLRGVQCESCHGRGGPHQSPEFVKAGFEPVCLGCHDPEHSLRFVFAERLPLVSHAANMAALANLSVDERRALAEKRAKRERALFDPGEFVGSASCAECHAKEHKLWSESEHAKAFATLEHKSEAKNADCLRCHTTGFKQPTGFPAGGSALAGVGCESCHGPGKKHVETKGKESGTIVALTDKCDTCAIAVICGTCHDDANDKGFEFAVEEKLAKIKHGFREKKTAAK
jgi:predicted CXXCH cytochrome family protein